MAAAYELTPLKNICLSKCRSPLGLLLGSWRDGWSGALRMGMRNGAWCVGCCWALMASLFALGVMSAVWMAVVAGADRPGEDPAVAPDRDLRHRGRPPCPRCAGARRAAGSSRSHRSCRPHPDVDDLLRVTHQARHIASPRPHSAVGVAAASPHRWPSRTTRPMNSCRLIVLPRVGLHPDHIERRILTAAPEPGADRRPPGLSVADLTARVNTPNVNDEALRRPQRFRPGRPARADATPGQSRARQTDFVAGGSAM